MLSARRQCLRGEAGRFCGLPDRHQTAWPLLGSRRRTRCRYLGRHGRSIRWRNRHAGQGCEMKSRLGILHLEDDPHDASLIESILRTEGFACRMMRVQTKAEFVQQLEAGSVDLILSDFA